MLDTHIAARSYIYHCSTLNIGIIWLEIILISHGKSGRFTVFWNRHFFSSLQCLTIISVVHWIPKVYYDIKCSTEVNVIFVFLLMKFWMRRWLDPGDYFCSVVSCRVNISTLYDITFDSYYINTCSTEVLSIVHSNTFYALFLLSVVL